MTASLIASFSSLEDPRAAGRVHHNLLDIVVLSICAIASGADGWESIEDFGHDKLDWLRQFIPLANGVPSDDCIARVLGSLSPTVFRECFMHWTQQVAKQTDDEVIAIDGKTVRGSRDQGCAPLHLVSAWACENRLVLAQEATAEKSNEITAIPRLLSLLELSGCIVTIDAMGCQHAIATQITEQGGDYVLGLKGNQSNLHEAVEDFFTTAHDHDFRGVAYETYEEIDKDHGRLEVRRYWVTEQLQTLPNTQKWTGLRSIGMVERECWQGDQRSIERRYFLNSIAADAQRFAHASRDHWGIENQLHWRMDVVLGDDACTIRQGNRPVIMTTMKQLCLNLFEQEPSKLSLAKKRRKASWNDNFRATVVFNQHF